MIKLKIAGKPLLADQKSAQLWYLLVKESNFLNFYPI